MPNAFFLLLFFFFFLLLSFLRNILDGQCSLISNPLQYPELQKYENFINGNKKTLACNQGKVKNCLVLNRTLNT